MPLSDRYEVLARVGQGAFGEVFRVRERRSGLEAAAKRLRVPPPADALQVLPAALFREVEALRQLRHPNIVELLDVVPDGSSVALVLEFVPADLFTLLRRRREPLEMADVRGLLRMLLLALAHCHDRGVLHRDLKPGNVLVTARGELKLSDFGLATVLPTAPATLSHQVATRWYRAPELLLGSRHYDAAVDMWAVGAILAELLALSPLFPGANDLDQLHRVLQVRGHLEHDWPEVCELPDFGKVSFPEYSPLPLSRVFRDAPVTAVDLLDKLLALNPRRRPTAREALAHEFFIDGPTNLRFSFAGGWHPTEGSDDRGEDVADAFPPSELEANVLAKLKLGEDDPFLASLGKPLCWNRAAAS